MLLTFFNRAESEVTIHYIDDAGTVISPSDTIIGYVNEELEVTIKEIENYKFLFERDNQLLNTVFTREQQNYWLVYILQGSMPPVDPLDPEIEVNPENKPELPENQGLLSIDFISSFNFGSQPISVHDQIYYAQPQRLLDEDGTVNEMEERPNYIQISDRRSATERNGWQLSVTQTKQFEGLKSTAYRCEYYFLKSTISDRSRWQYPFFTDSQPVNVGTRKQASADSCGRY